MGTQKPSPPPPSPAKHLPNILALTKKFNSERDLPQLLTLLTREAAQILDCEAVSILFYDREQCELYSQASADGEQIRLDARLGVAGAALMTDSILKVSNAEEDDRFFAGIDRQTKKRTRNLLAIPLKTASGELIGVFEAINKKKGTFSQRDQDIAMTIAEQGTLALDNAQCFHKLLTEHGQLHRENAQLRKEVNGRFSSNNLLGTSLRMQNLIRLIDQIQDSSVDVLITGENGTGKELVAKAIHYNSSRSRNPFVALNCASLPENLLETELFGIEKKVATDVDFRIGKFEQANGGTLFLDEIGDMGLRAQAKILRVLEERTLERVGGRTSIPLDVRILAATNKDLESAISRGRFRDDLYYRLKIVPIHTPSLRERPEDIPLLANFFLNKYCESMGKSPKKISPAAMRCLEACFWPGNVRQLENEMKRLVVTVRRSTITEEDLDDSIRFSSFSSSSQPHIRAQTLPQAVEELEQRLIKQALQACHHNQVRTAKALGLSRQGLIKKMKRYGIMGTKGSE
jgi:Nif-specific regulatory protein